ncbi:MAG: hypothetical protein Q8936_15125 [Bacillota bacterium]|nr:hypothetical protein [Bacillota bacterium]
MQRGAYDFQNYYYPYYCPYYQNFYNRQEEGGYEVIEEYPPKLPSGAYAIRDPRFVRRAVEHCNDVSENPRLQVTLDSGRTFTVRDFEAGRDSLYGINVADGGDELHEYTKISDLKCMRRRRVRNGDSYEYQYEECGCNGKLMPTLYGYNPYQFNYGTYFPWNPVNTFQNFVERDEPGMEGPPIEMAGSGEGKPDYTPVEPIGPNYRPLQIENILINCESGSRWVYIWTVEDTEFWAKVISHEDQQYVTLEGRGPISFKRIRKIVCYEQKKTTELPPEEDEGEGEGEYVIAKHFTDRNSSRAKMQMPYSPYLNPYYSCCPYNPNCPTI